MKYGVLWRKTTKNIGDDVQSYAASLWLPSVDYIVDIEDMEHFTAENDEPVATIMSAWYMWHKWYWPPSKYIHPLWIGFHYNDILRGRPRGMQSRFEYVDNGPGMEYLKNYEPIGCRDYYTQGVLDNIGIKNYYSGCVTLTLPRRDIPKPEREYVCLVGVSKAVEKAVRKQLKDTDIDVKVLPPTRPEPSTNLSWEERRDEVISYLDTYQNAKCVITFRLHCSLPCLALETPVLLVRDSFNSVRFNPYKDFLHHAFPQEVIDGKYRDFLLNPPPNPDAYKPVRESLSQTIRTFIDECEHETRTATELSRLHTDPVELLQWQHDTMQKTLDNFFIESRYDFDELKAVKRQLSKANADKAKLQEKLDKEREKNREMQNILNSRIVRFAVRIRGWYRRLLGKDKKPPKAE